MANFNQSSDNLEFSADQNYIYNLVQNSCRPPSETSDRPDRTHTLTDDDGGHTPYSISNSPPSAREAANFMPGMNGRTDRGRGRRTHVRFARAVQRRGQRCSSAGPPLSSPFSVALR